MRRAVPERRLAGRQGRFPPSLAKAFVHGVEAPHKAFAAIKRGHFAVFMNASEFLKELSGLLATAAR